MNPADAVGILSITAETCDEPTVPAGIRTKQSTASNSPPRWRTALPRRRRDLIWRGILQIGPTSAQIESEFASHARRPPNRNFSQRGSDRVALVPYVTRLISGLGLGLDSLSIQHEFSDGYMLASRLAEEQLAGWREKKRDAQSVVTVYQNPIPKSECKTDVGRAEINCSQKIHCYSSPSIRCFPF